MSKVKPIPEGYHSVTPYLTLHDAANAIEFYKKAFSAQVVTRMDSPDGKVAHAEMRIGDSIVMLGDEMPRMGTKSPTTLGGTTGGIMIYVTDVDKTFQQALAAGAKAEMPVADMFWGDRYGRLVDPYGHSWSIGTHKEDVAPEEMKRRMETEMAKMRQRQSGQGA